MRSFVTANDVGYLQRGPQRARHGGQVSHLGIELWSVDELRYIAQRGFEALNIVDEHGVGQRLAENSYGAPFLMQELCFEYATSLGVLQTAALPVATVEPPDWSAMFKRIATATRRSSSSTC